MRGGENRLASETSAYLRQHMHNPVDWYPWGPEALDEARTLGKPLLVSIGYSACHWCHVMERESFEAPETAALMNRHFVNIKVDREERPDVDQIYMDAVVRWTGHGGWPLTMFCLPDGRPFYGGTYFPPVARSGLPAFSELLEGVAHAFQNRRGEVEQSATQILQALEPPSETAPGEIPPAKELIDQAAAQLMQRADRVHGGFGAAPKFPTATNLELLIAACADAHPSKAQEISDFLLQTCREMSRRGLYDQLGGGFHRYCVDDHWGVPHFEKMLYDQGQLLRFYAGVWRLRGGSEEELLWPIRETAAYLEREMRPPGGGYAASQDADSEGVEGKFYVWRPAEVRDVLGQTASAFSAAYHVSEEGNFEGASVLWDIARGSREDFREAREQLYRARAERIWPARDDKRVAAWNGLVASGLAYAGSLLADAQLLEAAGELGRFFTEKLCDSSGRLHRVFAEGAPRVPAFLDDLAGVCTACLDLYRAGCGDEFATAALRFGQDIVVRFYDPAEEDLFLTPSDAEPLALRPRSDRDGATPQASGLAVASLLRCAALSGERSFADVAERVLARNMPSAARVPQAFPTLLRAARLLERGIASAVVLGERDNPATQALADAARTHLAPDDAVVVAVSGTALPVGVDMSLGQGREPQGGRPTAFVCRGTYCTPPIHEPSQLSGLTD